MESETLSQFDIGELFGQTKSQIIHELSYSDLSMEDLSRILDMNKTAVKEHMDSLERKGFVKSFFKPGGAGRPRKFYQLTEKGFELLPKRYVDFAKVLMEEIEKEFGREKASAILAGVADRFVSSAGWVRDDIRSLSREQKLEKLKEFVSVLNKLGYYARLEVTDDVVRIVRHNCIFYELAKSNNRIICGTLGSDIIKSSIYDDFKIVEKFSEGNNRCVVEVNLK
ncbi:MAG TPA: ArsR family transcriptional regulator [Thermoplasmataceae archaeon]|nr:ArsR family transcriptional regulator [Thermoplasmataceae archaeon]